MGKLLEAFKILHSDFDYILEKRRKTIQVGWDIIQWRIRIKERRIQNENWDRKVIMNSLVQISRYSIFKSFKHWCEWINYVIVSSQTHIHSSLCSAQKITEDRKFQRVMKKGINNARRRTSKTPRLLFTLADITNSDFQIFIYHGDCRSCNGDESGSFQEFFENSNRNSVWKAVKFSYN